MTPADQPVEHAPPVTRWERAEQPDYGDRFARLIADGEDVDGEARLVDAVAPRRATVLDAGSGMGRVGAALQVRGHDVTAVEKDATLVAQSRSTYPGLPVVVADLWSLTPALLAEAGRPTSYDVVVVVGNVMVLLAEATERRVLGNLAALLGPDGRMVVGFRVVDAPHDARAYPVEAFADDAASVGLVVRHRFGGYDLREDPEYAVLVLERARGAGLSVRGRRAAPAPTA